MLYNGSLSRESIFVVVFFVKTKNYGRLKSFKKIMKFVLIFFLSNF